MIMKMKIKGGGEEGVQGKKGKKEKVALISNSFQYSEALTTFAVSTFCNIFSYYKLFL